MHEMKRDMRLAVPHSENSLTGASMYWRRPSCVSLKNLFFQVRTEPPSLKSHPVRTGGAWVSVV
jgi:hypothetical protein